MLEFGKEGFTKELRDEREVPWQRGAGRLSRWGNVWEVALLSSSEAGDRKKTEAKSWETRGLWTQELRGRPERGRPVYLGEKRPLSWSDNGGVQRRPRSALGAPGLPHHLSRMLLGLCWDARRSTKTQ